MVAFSQWPLQQAIYQALEADATLSGLVAGVYDRVPENAVMPYVAFGDAVGRDWSSATTQGFAFDTVIHVYSRGGGRLEAAAIMDRLHVLLHDAPLSPSGQTLIMLRYESSGISLDKDGVTHHGVMVLRALIQAGG
jgi:hypothetical protein